MKSSRKFEPRTIHAADEDGSKVVLVEMSNRPGTFATLDRTDWDMRQSGYSLRMFLNGVDHYQYVRACRKDVKGSLSSVARDLIEPGRGRIVGYHDGDKLNLRRRNLFVQQGWASGQTPADDAAVQPPSSNDRPISPAPRPANTSRSPSGAAPPFCREIRIASF